VQLGLLAFFVGKVISFGDFGCFSTGGINTTPVSIVHQFSYFFQFFHIVSPHRHEMKVGNVGSEIPKRGPKDVFWGFPKLENLTPVKL